MARTTYDVVVVGARCAGAAVAIHLARKGASVAVLEAGRLGTDQVLSTHTIHPAGMDQLDELGVGAAVRDGSPPARRIRFQVDDTYADIEPPDGRYECCPRRYRLDSLLQQAASAAGAELRESTRVIDVLRDGDRVGGVRAVHDGHEIEIRGAITVGADGRHSTIAKLVEAEEYLGYDAPRAMVWAYWKPPSVWSSSEYPYDFLLLFQGTRRRVIFPTDDEQLLLATLPPVDEARMWKSDLERHEGAKTSKVIGTLSERFFYRRSAGAGWALVGDAGHHKDPILGWGISEALLQAKELAEAIGTGEDAAIELYWRRRDVETLPRFRMGEDRAAPKPMSAVLPVVLRKTSTHPSLKMQLFSETEYGVNPYEVLPVSKVALWTLKEVLRGRPGLILDFFAQGKRANSVRAELKKRAALLDEAAAVASLGGPVPWRLPSRMG
jgi:flavin-dependent dehydrogenase